MSAERPRPGSVVITCEHGGNRVPPDWAAAMAPDQRLLATHRGYDPGALDLAFLLAAALRAPLHLATTTRLLVDLNRSLNHPMLHGPSAWALEPRARSRIIRDHYAPYRRAVEQEVARMARRDPGCYHISVHTFTPVLRGQVRRIDIGLLFDPARPREAALARRWAAAIRRSEPRLRVRLNQPYNGTDDGLTTHLRTLHPDEGYAGIELEVNQRFVRAGGPRWLRLERSLAQALLLALAQTSATTSG